MDKIEQLLSGRKKKKSSSPKNLSQEVRKSNLSQEQCRTRKGKPIESSSKKKKSKERTVETFEACETKEEQTKEEDPAADKKKTEKFAEAEQELATAPWYHGLMPREEILEMLTKDGDFLVRKTEVGLHPHYALSVWSDNKPHHMLLKLNDQYRWYVSKTKNFDKIREMVDFYMKNTDKTFMPNKLVTKNPVLRPPWYIIHENVVLIKKYAIIC
uniref:SH2 domain-containing protein n=1 Tax=Panagrolaimus sp. JU765 TaxID=591449 RepID=A0AC34R2H4_9BILA